MKKLTPLLAVLCLILTGCGFARVTYREYITAVLDCTYHEEYQQYQEFTDASQLSAEAVYADEKSALSQRLRNTYGIQSDKISEDLIQSYDDLAGTILHKTTYSVRDVVNTDNTYIVVLVIAPIDFWQMTKFEVQDYYDFEFTEKYANAPTQAAADRLEEEFASRVLDILTEHVETLGYLEPIVYTFEIENNTISAQTWQEIDRLILNLD